MHIKDLARWDFPEDLISAWEKEGIESLLPIQEQAIKRHRLFEGGNMIVSAPTSSGKTFVGEMAAVYQGLKGKRAVYLVPLKALAEEKFQNFKKLYEPYDLKIVISTRDHKEFDIDLDKGDFEIAIIVYEKFFSLLNSSAKFLDQIGLIVIDELQLLSDPSRGSNLELILTKLKMLKNSFQLIGLSAVLGKDSGVDKWLDIDLLQYSRRPVELRTGYLYNGVFHYQTYNSRETGEEVLLPDSPAEKLDIMIAAVSRLAKLGEQSLIFLMDKASTRRIAKEIAGNSNLHPAAEALEELSHLEATISNEELAQVLSSGVAFHHADLTIEERLLVEHHFREGNIRVLVSTTTLAMGVNLPTRNVFIELRKWHTEPGERQPIQIDLPKSDFENMGGRAGRFQLEDEFGRAIAVVTRKIERDQFRHKYHDGELEAIVPNLWRDSMATTVLGIIALGDCRKIEEVRSFLLNTLTWYLLRKDGVELDKLNEQLDRGIADCLRIGVLHVTEAHELILTDLGETVAATGIRVETAGIIKKWLDKRYNSPISATEAILAAVITPDGQEAYLNMSTPEYHNKSCFYDNMIHDLLGKVLQDVFDALLKYRMDNYEIIKSYKVALLLTDYISLLSNRELEKNYSTFFGAIKRVSEQISWVLSSSAGIAKALNYPPNEVDMLNHLSTTLQHGLTIEGVFLAELRVPRLGRERIRALVQEGIESFDDILEAGEDFISGFTTKPVAAELFRRIKLLKQSRNVDESIQMKTEADRTTSNIGMNHSQNHGNIVVGVNHGVINVSHDDGNNGHEELVEQEVDDGPEDLTTLGMIDWRRETKHLVETLSPNDIGKLFETVRTLHHNKLRPLLRDARTCKTVRDFKVVLQDIWEIYNELCLELSEQFEAIILPSYIEDFELLSKDNAPLQELQVKFESLGNEILKRTNRLLNIVEEFKLSPELLLLQAIESCNGELSRISIDDTGLLTEDDQQESFFRQQELIEAFSNLIRNASESMQVTANPNLYLTSGLSGGQTAIRIIDNGCGIKPEDAERIFNDRFSTKGSNGFGLVHARRVFESYGGSLGLIKSEPNINTIFEVVI